VESRETRFVRTRSSEPCCYRGATPTEDENGLPEGKPLIYWVARGGSQPNLSSHKNQIFNFRRERSRAKRSV